MDFIRFWPSCFTLLQTASNVLNNGLAFPATFGKGNGGEGGIRTLGRVLAYVRFRVECLQPLSHLSLKREAAK